ncbi:hypothetical protein [Undibacterium sp.]|uniref:hypothetical protein n=1 Tax=Undibacterium sp. TaxID=1914977 RepID=UPI0037538AD2
MVEVEITGLVITAQYGTLKTGDILRCPKEFADHLVKDAMAAKYRAEKEPEQTKVDAVEKKAKTK